MPQYQWKRFFLFCLWWCEEDGRLPGRMLGGFRNESMSQFSTIRGRRSNNIPKKGSRAAILGGRENSMSGKSSSVNKRTKNVAAGLLSTMSRGDENGAYRLRSSLLAGENNTANKKDSSFSRGEMATQL